MFQEKIALENLIQNSPWKEFASNTNYAFDPYGETEEKNMTTNTHVMGKEKSRHRSTSSSQQTTLPMSHSPTNKSQMYYESTNGHGKGAQEYRSNGAGSGGGGGGARSSGSNSHQRSNGNSGHAGAHYDRYERNASHESGPGPYSRSTYAERAYSLPRQQYQQQSNMQPSGYYTQDRRTHRQPSDERRGYGERDRSREDPRSNGGSDTPDFYFMPSQRKYSGEVVRVYVDYNKDPKH